MTLDAVERAADSLGLEQKKEDGALLVKVRRKTWLAVRSDGGGVRAEGQISGGPAWRIWLLYVGIAVAVGVAVWPARNHQWGRWGWMQDLVVVLLMVGFVGILIELVYSPWQLAYSRKRLLKRAQRFS